MKIRVKQQKGKLNYRQRQLSQRYKEEFNAFAKLVEEKIGKYTVKFKELCDGEDEMFRAFASLVRMINKELENNSHRLTRHCLSYVPVKK